MTVAIRSSSATTWYWLGGNDRAKEGTWVWPNGDPIGPLTNWFPGRINDLLDIWTRALTKIKLSRWKVRNILQVIDNEACPLQQFDRYIFDIMYTNHRYIRIPIMFFEIYDVKGQKQSRNHSMHLYALFTPGEPNSGLSANCMLWYPGRWVDGICSQSRPSICSKPAEDK